MTNYYRNDPEEYKEDIQTLYANVSEGTATLHNFFMLVVALLADAYDEGELEGYANGYDAGYAKGYRVCESDLEDEEGEF